MPGADVRLPQCEIRPLARNRQTVASWYAPQRDDPGLPALAAAGARGSADSRQQVPLTSSGGDVVSQKRQADEAAATSGLGRRIRYHRGYRMPALALYPFVLAFIVLCVTLLPAQFGLWSVVFPVAAVGGLATYVLWPASFGVRAAGIYDGGLVLITAQQAIAVPWKAITRVVYKPGRSHSASNGPFSGRTVHVEYALTQVWLVNATAPVALIHIWRHKRLFRAIQRRFNPAPVGGAAR